MLKQETAQVLRDLTKPATRGDADPDFANAGLLIRLHANRATADDLQRFLTVLVQIPAFDSNGDEFWVVRRLFFVSRMLTKYLEHYRAHRDRYTLIQECISEMGRIVGEDKS